MAEEQQRFLDKHGVELARGDLCKAYNAGGDLVSMCAEDLLRLERLELIEGKPKVLLHNDHGISLWWDADKTERISRDPGAGLSDMSDQQLADHARALMKDFGAAITVMQARGFKCFLLNMEVEAMPSPIFRRTKVEEV
jgi:hypothetical protein